MATANDNHRTELLILLQNHSNLRTGQDQVLWNIFGAFWTTNALLLVSIFAADAHWCDTLVIVTISIIGIIISLVWTFIQHKAIKRIEIYERAIEKIEAKLKIEDDLCAFYRVSSKGRKMQ